MKQILDNKLEIHSELLREIDIKMAIDYFGNMELLDNMDYFVIANYLTAWREDRLYEDVSGSGVSQ